MQVYRSIHHPGDAAAPLLFAQWLVRPLGICLLPVMVLSLVRALQGAPILDYLVFGFPGAVVIASAWTAYRIRTAPAEIAVSGPYAEVRTVLDVLRNRPRNPWRIVLDVRRAEDHVYVAIGEAVFDLADSDWPEPWRLVKGLQGARMAPETEPAALPTDRPGATADE